MTNDNTFEVSPPASTYAPSSMAGAEAAPETEPEAKPVPPTVAECPDPDGSNITGVYLHPGVEGDYVTLEATENARTGYEAEGFKFIGYLPA